eukprot:5407363-Pyramimonas_sp.AAC.1
MDSPGGVSPAVCRSTVPFKKDATYFLPMTAEMERHTASAVCRPTISANTTCRVTAGARPHTAHSACRPA